MVFSTETGQGPQFMKQGILHLWRSLHSGLTFPQIYENNIIYIDKILYPQPPHLLTLVLLVATVVGVAGELAGVAAGQSRVTGKDAASLGELLFNVLASDDSLELQLAYICKEFSPGMLPFHNGDVSTLR